MQDYLQKFNNMNIPTRVVQMIRSEDRELRSLGRTILANCVRDCKSNEFYIDLEEGYRYHMSFPGVESIWHKYSCLHHTIENYKKPK